MAEREDDRPAAAEGASPLPAAWWRFEDAKGGVAWDSAGGVEDVIEGSFELAPGVSGSGLKLDGFTTVVVREAAKAPALGGTATGGFTIEAWLALAAYPWNVCPVVSQCREGEAGYRLAVGPRGELVLEVVVKVALEGAPDHENSGVWRTCASADFALPLRGWAHVAGTFDGERGLAVYVDGKEEGRLDCPGTPAWAPDVDLRIGMDHVAKKPSHIHREFGTLPSWFSLDGILDEVKIHARAFGPDQVRAAHAADQPSGEPALAPRVMPSGPVGPGRFGAYYCRLDYYDEWDALWPVGPDPDVVVRFDRSPVKVVFWRGTRYSPAWVTENGLWMADQSVEAWNGEEGCFEHMQDRHCRYSHVRVIETSDARVVVHWRYAPVSVNDNLWRVDPKTGRACWVDEYYTIYPDATAVRHVSWKKGTLGGPRQFQESIVLAHPGQLQGDVIDADFCTVANLRGESGVLSFIDDPGKGAKKVKRKEGVPEDLVIQRHNLKSKARPFVIFEPGNRMHYVVDRDAAALSRPGSCCHWPVGLARSDGRTSQAADRPTSFLGFPISDPPVHEDAEREWVHSLYGMTEQPVDELVVLARSWARPAEPTVKSAGFTSDGYDMAQRAYRIAREGPGGRSELALELAGSDESPVLNPAFVVRDWGTAGVALRVDGGEVERGKVFRAGHRHRLAGSDLVVWLELECYERAEIVMAPVQGQPGTAPRVIPPASPLRR